jgi:4-alpha-glucanotransferase
MNDPAKTGGNWRWEMASGALTPSLAKRLRELTEAAGR